MLEDDLGVRLFERSSGRQPRLTDAGAALLEEAREVLRQCRAPEWPGAGSVRGQEVRLRLAQDEAMPYQPVLDSLEALAQQFPLLEVQLASGAQGDVARKLLEHRADLGLLFHHEQCPTPWSASAWDHRDGYRLRCRIMPWRVWVMLIGANWRATGNCSWPLRTVITRAASSSAHRFGGLTVSTPWPNCLMRNLGWAWLPRHVAQYPTYQGQLVELSSDWTPPPLVVELVCRRDEAHGPAALWLAECFATHLQAIG